MNRWIMLLQDIRCWVYNCDFFFFNKGEMLFYLKLCFFLFIALLYFKSIIRWYSRYYIWYHIQFLYDSNLVIYIRRNVNWSFLAPHITTVNAISEFVSIILELSQNTTALNNIKTAHPRNVLECLYEFK